jgi:phosphoglycerate dehydrogenase-like enzyme
MARTYPGLDPIEYEPGAAPPADAARARALVAVGFSWEDEKPLVEAAPHLAWVQAISAGVDHLRGLPLSIGLGNGRGANGGCASEMALALLLSVFRRVPDAVRAQSAAHWEALPGKTLVDAEVLVVGAGDLAHEFRTRAEACGASVTLVGRTAREEIHATSELPALLPGKDAVVILVPLTDSTHHMVDAAFLARMDQGSVLINAARGGVVDTDALIAACSSGRLRAGLDVTDPEPLPADHPLWSCPGVLITPHVGGQVNGFFKRAFRVAFDQVAQFARGEKPTNTVPLDERV